MLGPAYPSRGDHFAFRFCRLLTKTAAALEIGAEGCWLLAVVVMQEDACRYRRAVRFYSEQLMGLLGMSRAKTFRALRDRLVAGGWLHYQSGGTRQAGLYWVLVPEHAQGIGDGVTAETAGESAPNPAPNGAQIAPAIEPKSRPQSSPHTAPPPSLSLAPVPSPSNRERDGAAPRLSGFEHLLENLLVSNTARMRGRWRALAVHEGGAATEPEIEACVEWAVLTARKAGRAVNHPNHVIAEAHAWAACELPRLRRKGGAA
jgi:hypothetical protein